MKSRSFPFVVGLFVLISFALIFGMTLFLGASNYLKPKFYAETLIEESVSGLTVGSAVKLRGVPCGEVKSIGFLRSGPQTSELGSQFKAPVRVLMELSRDMFIADDQGDLNRRVAEGVKRGLRARPTQAGLTGALVIELTIVEPVPADDFRPPPDFGINAAYIPSVPGLLGEFVDRLSTITDNFSKVDFEAIGAHLEKLLADGDVLVNQKIGPAVDELRAILADKRIESILANVDGATKSISELLGTEGHEDLRAFIAQLPEIGAKAKDLVAKIDSVVSNPKIPQVIDTLDANLGPTLASIRRTVDRIDGFVASEQYDLRELVQTLRTLATNLDELAAELKSDPAKLIFSKPAKPIEPAPIPAEGGKR